VVIDAGDRTVEVNSYIVKSTSPLEAEEFFEPKCNGLFYNLTDRTDRKVSLLPGC